jgi:hypothetical protein
MSIVLLAITLIITGLELTLLPKRGEV